MKFDNGGQSLQTDERNGPKLMIAVRETIKELPFYAPIALTSLPLIYHREHLFPYTSQGDTSATPVSRSFRMVVLENDLVRAEIAPELGGRVYSFFDKRIGKEILFSNPVVKPVRILPIWAFISGGIEFNFPIAHSPTSIAEVGCSTGRTGDYACVRVGEREARSGMEWVVELGLSADRPELIQRTWLRNQTARAHPWMMWTICALPSTSTTEFVHPPHQVLLHDDRVTEAAWPGEGLNWDRNYRQMTALFWKPGSAAGFGAFHHKAGFGLMHMADPNRLPGKKLWTYGHGKHRAWGEGTTTHGLSYCEIESGPLLDQNEKPLFPAGGKEYYEEYWVPVHLRDECERLRQPNLKLPVCGEPWLGWRHSKWQSEWEQFRAGDAPLPNSVVPTGLQLEKPLRAELENGNRRAIQPLSLWLAFHGRPEEALEVLEGAVEPESKRVAGLILWKGLNRPAEAVGLLEQGPLEHAFAAAELDELYAELGKTQNRVELLKHAPAHRLIGERRADLALELGQPAEALRILQTTPWPREHQRHVRSELWKRAKAVLGEPAPKPPDFLNEDNLARFGAYWSD